MGGGEVDQRSKIFTSPGTFPFQGEGNARLDWFRIAGTQRDADLPEK
jgi:hypothetical protein